MIDLRFQNTPDQRSQGQVTLVGPLFTRQIQGRLGRFLGIELECPISMVREDRPNGDLVARKSCQAHFSDPRHGGSGSAETEAHDPGELI